MRTMIMAVLSAAFMGTALAPAFAADNQPNCESLPRAQYAQCILDRAQEGSSQ